MTTFFTSDHHFGHANILEYSDRPFSSIEEHDSVLVDNWNSVVSPGDLVYHLGDFVFGKEKWKYDRACELLSVLNGQVHLIRGNHDYGKMLEAPWASVHKYKTIKVKTPDGPQRIFLCHYAMRVWNQSHYGVWSLFGHSHGSLVDDPQSLSTDVGVDTQGYTPVSFERVGEIMKGKTWVPVDHHGRGA